MQQILGTSTLFVFASLAAVGLAPAAVGQVPGEQAVAFDVASIRANRSGDLAMPARTRGRTFIATNIPLRYLVASAYSVPAARVLGGPAWAGSASVEMRLVGGDRFDVVATLPDGAAANQVPSMLRTLLADRFKLVARLEMREAPLYALAVRDGRLGPRLRQASMDCEAALAAGTQIPSAKPGERGACAAEIGGEIIGRGQRLDALARMLSLFADRPVVDRTGLTGGFDFDLRFPELDTSTSPGRADGGGGIFAAVQEQLGLKLEPVRGPLEFVIIESAAQPTEN